MDWWTPHLWDLEKKPSPSEGLIGYACDKAPAVTGYKKIGYLKLVLITI